MGLWFYLYLIINLSILIIYYKRKNGFVEAPFLMAYTAIFVLIPQFATIYNNPFYDKRLIPDLGIMMISCNLAFVAGFELVQQFVFKREDEIGILHLDKIRNFLIIISIIGFTSIFLWEGKKFQEGDNVIQANIKSFSQMALCLVITGLLTYHTKAKIAIYIYLLSVVPLFYFAFFVKGSRGETLFLLFTIAFYFTMKYPEKKPLIKKWTFIILLAGALFSASIIWVRNVVINKSANTELSLVDNFINSFSQKKVSLGMDLGNTALGIQYLKESNQMDYGTDVYDNLIQNVIPRRIVGESLKERLKLNIVKDQNFIKRQTHGVTTMTGYYWAFRAFSYLGFILFFIIGAIYGIAYSKIRNSASCLYLYLLILPTTPLVFTHGPGYLYIKIYMGFLLAYLFCYHGFKRYRIVKGNIKK